MHLYHIQAGSLLTLLTLSTSALTQTNIPSGGSPRISTSTGTFVGAFNSTTNITYFKGIPYAQPPVGKLRFAPPAPISKTSKGEQNAAVFKDACPQPPIVEVSGFNFGPPLNVGQSEDCLYLNVWLPGTNETSFFNTSSLPILVYIHGGGWGVGSGSEWDPTGFIHRSLAVDKPVIFITINYRLGSLGFLGSSRVPSESLNVGLQDQRAAFGWIKENAVSFGGDPEKVTIAGESAGAASVHFHLLYPDPDKSLFRAGISDSGTAMVSNTPSCSFYDDTIYALLGNFTGCGSDEGSFEYLRDLPLETYWNASMQTDASSGTTLPSNWAPCIGAYLKGDYLDLPTITGTNLNEATIILAAPANSFLSLPPMSPENESAIFGSFLSSQPDNGHTLSNSTLSTIQSLYPSEPPVFSNSSLFERAVDFSTDYAFRAPQRLFLDSTLKYGRDNTWAFMFGQRLPGAPNFLAVFHTSELYLLDIGFTPVPQENLTSVFQDYYINFVDDQDPGASWERYSLQKKVIQLVDGNVMMIPDTLRENGTDFLNSDRGLAEFGKLG